MILYGTLHHIHHYNKQIALLMNAGMWKTCV